MNEGWKTEAEVSNIVCPLRELPESFVNSKMCFNRVVRLARGVQKSEPQKSIKWVRLLRASWAEEFGHCVAGSGEPWQTNDTVERSGTKFS